MTDEAPDRVLSIVVCGAGPAIAIATFVKLAIDRGWTVQVIATPAALDFFDQAAIEALTGNPGPQPVQPARLAQVTDTRRDRGRPGHVQHDQQVGTREPATPTPSACSPSRPAMGLPIVVLPFVNAALASRAPFQHNVESLRAEGVSILLGPGAIEPHQPHTGGALIDTYPWHLALDEIDSMLTPPHGDVGPAVLNDRAQAIQVSSTSSATRVPASQMSPVSIIRATDSSGTHSTRAASLRSPWGRRLPLGVQPTKAKCSEAAIPGSAGT